MLGVYYTTLHFYLPAGLFEDSFPLDEFVNGNARATT